MNEELLKQIDRQVIEANQKLVEVEKKLTTLHEIYNEKENELHELGQLIDKLETQRDVKLVQVHNFISNMIDVHMANISEVISNEAFDIYVRHTDE